MQEAEINKQLNADHFKFTNSLYSGRVSTPENIIEMFKNAILAMPPFAHKIMFTKIKSICSKEVEQLTNDDLADIIRVTLNISLERLYPYLDFDQMVEEQIYFDKFTLCFNTYVEDFKQGLNQKRERLKSLSTGINGNGLKLVN